MAGYRTTEDASYVLRVITYLESRVLLVKRTMKSMLMRGLETEDQSSKIGSWLFDILRLLLVERSMRSMSMRG